MMGGESDVMSECMSECPQRGSKRTKEGFGCLSKMETGTRISFRGSKSRTISAARKEINTSSQERQFKYDVEGGPLYVRRNRRASGLPNEDMGPNI
jgi:hypothetical protein